MMQLRDKPRFDSFGYWPNTPSQWREPTVDDCTWYAGEFAFQAADSKHRNYHPVKDIRNQSSDTDGGTPVDVMLRDMFQFWPKDGGVQYLYGGFTKRDIRRALETGATVVVGGDYEKLPLHYRRWTNNDYFNHAMAHRFLHTWKSGTAVTALYDPLGGGVTRDPYDGEWIPMHKMYGDDDEYAWRVNSVKYWAGIVDNDRKDKAMKRVFFDPQDSQREAQVFRITPIYATPSVTSDKVKTLMDDTKWYKLVGRVNPDWFAIFSWNKDTKEHDIAYVAASDLKNIRPRVPTEYVPDNDHEVIITTLTAERDEARLRLRDLAEKAEMVTATYPPFADAVEALGN